MICGVLSSTHLRMTYVQVIKVHPDECGRDLCVMRFNNGNAIVASYMLVYELLKNKSGRFDYTRVERGARSKPVRSGGGPWRDARRARRLRFRPAWLPLRVSRLASAGK